MKFNTLHIKILFQAAPKKQVYTSEKYFDTQFIEHKYVWLTFSKSKSPRGDRAQNFSLFHIFKIKMNTKTLTVQCPTCAAPVAWLPENAFRPFCSETCQLIDLGEWASDTRAIACAPNAEDWLDLPE